MSSNPITEISTGISAEVYEYLWKVENFLLVNQDRDLINQQTFEVEIPNPANLRSKLMFGFKVVENNPSVFRVFFKLLHVRETRLLSLKVVYDLLLKDGTPGNYTQNISKTLSMNDEVEMLRNMAVANADSWANCIDEDGALKLLITLSVFHPTEANKKAGLTSALETFQRSSEQVVLQNFGNLLMAKEYADVTITCSDDMELSAHKIILAAQSPVFATMFSSDFAENKSGAVHADDISGKTMKLLLHYMYTGKLLDGWSDEDTIVEFTYAAGKYQLTAVLEMLDNVLGNEGTSWSSALLMNLAGKLSLKTAEARLMERIVKMVNSAATSMELLKLFENAK